MKVLKYAKKSPEGKRVDKEKSDGRELQIKRFEARSLIRPSCGCGCVPPVKEK